MNRRRRHFVMHDYTWLLAADNLNDDPDDDPGDDPGEER